MMYGDGRSGDGAMGGTMGGTMGGGGRRRAAAGGGGERQRRPPPLRQPHEARLSRAGGVRGDQA